MRLSPGLWHTLNSSIKMGRPKVTLYVDTVSPFAYEAYYILRNDAVFKNCDITYVPIFLGGLMHKCGNTAPIKIKNKDTWINRERLRWASAFNIPMFPGLPPDFPAPSLPIMRVLCAVANSGNSEKLTQALDTFFSEHWAKGVATHKPEVLKATLEGLWGVEEAERLLALSTTLEIKTALTANTDAAFDTGAFGLPWMVCTDSQGKTEGFWGVDHLGQVVQFLGLDKGSGEGRGWRAVL